MSGIVGKYKEKYGGDWARELVDAFVTAVTTNQNVVAGMGWESAFEDTVEDVFALLVDTLVETYTQQENRVFTDRRWAKMAMALTKNPFIGNVEAWDTKIEAGGLDGLVEVLEGLAQASYINAKNAETDRVALNELHRDLDGIGRLVELTGLRFK